MTDEELQKSLDEMGFSPEVQKALYAVKAEVESAYLDELNRLRRQLKGVTLRLPDCPPAEYRKEHPQFIARMNGQQFGNVLQAGVNTENSSEIVWVTVGLSGDLIARHPDLHELLERTQTYMDTWEAQEGSLPPQMPELLEW